MLLAAAASAQPLHVQGTVRDSAGEVVVGAPVALLPFPTRYQEALALLGDGELPAPVEERRSGEDGRFALLAPAAGVYRVVVAPRGFVPVEYGPLAMVGPVELPPAVVVPNAGARIAVLPPARGLVVQASTARDSPGSPVPGPARADGWRPKRRVGRTSGAGTLTLPRAPGERLSLQIALPWSSVPQRVEGVEGIERLEILAAEAPPRRRKVEVRHHDGSAAAGVVLVRVEDGWPLGVTGADGGVELAGEPGEPLAVELLPPLGGYHRVELAPAPALLTLPAPERAVGRVVVAPGGSPVHGALVWSGADPGRFTGTAADGAYDLPVPGKRSWVQAEAWGLLPRRFPTRPAAGGSPAAATLTLHRPGLVLGRIVDPAGLPLRSIAVAALAAERPGRRPFFRLDRADERTSTDPAGGFFLDALTPGVIYRLTAEARGYEPSVTTLSGPTADAEQRLEIVLEPSVAAWGVVLDAEEAPVAGAEIQVYAAGSERPPTVLRNPDRKDPGDLYAATTDGRGRFEIRALPAPIVDVEVRARGFAEVWVPGVSATATLRPVNLGVFLLAPGIRLSGRVVDDQGHGVAGASVWGMESLFLAPGFSSEDLPPGREEAEPTAADGSFILSDLPPPGSSLGLLVEAEGFVTARLGGIELPAPEPVEISLTPGAMLAGIVRDEAGEPMPGAALTASPGDLPEGILAPGARTAGPPQTLRSAKDGTFAFTTLPAGVWALRAEAAGYQPAESGEVALEAGQQLTGLTLVLARGATLLGRVLTPGDEAVSGAWVRSEHQSARTDEEGRYRLDGVASGLQEIAVRHPAFPPAAVQLEVEPGDNLLDLVLEPGQGVSGRVASADDAPVAGAALTLSGGDLYREHRTESDEDGRFTFAGVAPGSYELEVAADGYAPRHDGPIEVDGAPVEDLLLTLEPTAVVTGHIVGLAFEELVRVQLVAEEAGGTWRRGRVGYDGAFEIQGLGPGRWHLKAQLSGGRREAGAWVTLEHGEPQTEQDLEFQAGLALSGLALHAGLPLSGAQVVAMSAEGGRREAVADHQGRFRIEDLAPGRYDVEISSARELVVDNRTIELEADLEIVIDVTTVQLGGRVTSPEGNALPDALVILQRLLDGGGEGGILTLGTAADGSFHFARLSTGRYRLEVRREGYVASGRDLDLDSDVEGLELVATPVPTGS